jgi:polyadenylate-binding protein
MRFDDLAALSPVVRKEVLTGELSRRVKALDTVSTSEVDRIVEHLVSLSLSDAVSGIQDPARFAEQVATARNSLKPPSIPSPAKSPSPSDSQDSRLLDATALNATASAPEHPSTPISIPASLSTPPRTSSPSGSVPPISEQDRMAAAVSKLESSRQAELVELLMSLPKRERAMCLFNTEILRAKVADAKLVLDSDDGDEEQQKPDTQSIRSAPAQAVPVTPQAKKTTATSEDSPRTPALSSKGPSAASSPVPVTPGSSSSHTLASLARLPAAEIIKLANSSSATGLPLPKPDPLVIKTTDDFIDGLLDKPIQAQKQQLGDKLYVGSGIISVMRA